MSELVMFGDLGLSPLGRGVTGTWYMEARDTAKPPAVTAGLALSKLSVALRLREPDVRKPSAGELVLTL